MSDRTVHARTRLGNEVVRYNRSGKWYVESAHLPRQRLTIDQAVKMALHPNTEVFLGRPGGGRFDHQYKRATGINRV